MGVGVATSSSNGLPSILVTGARGLLGSALVRALNRRNVARILAPSRIELDLTDQLRVQEYFRVEKPDVVIHCAALVGGIKANMSRPVDFLQQNLRMQMNVFESAFASGVSKLVGIGSNCMYPINCPQPMAEETLFTGPIEPTNLAYGTAKLAGYVHLKSLAQQYGLSCFTVIPASLYGPCDNFDLEGAHVVPSLLRRFIEATERNDPRMIMWGTGNPRREVMFVDDAAEGVLNLLFKSEMAPGDVINLGVGTDYSIRELAEAIAKTVGYTGALEFDANKPDGNLRKLLDSRRAQGQGFQVTTSLESGLRSTYQWFLEARKLGQVRGVSS
jgi:GDP-L-fucose synthase